MAHSIPPIVPAIDMQGFAGIAAGPAVASVLMAGLAQSLGHLHGTDTVAAVGGPVPLLLGTAVLLYAVFALVHLLHALGDRLTGQPTPLWWQPSAVGEEEAAAEPARGAARESACAAVPLFPNHLDGAVLSGGLSLAAWLLLTGVI